MSHEKITADCNSLEKIKVGMTITGRDLKVLNNALFIFRQYEPETCDPCAQSLERLEIMVSEGLAQCMGHVELHDEGKRQKP